MSRILLVWKLWIGGNSLLEKKNQSGSAESIGQQVQIFLEHTQQPCAEFFVDGEPMARSRAVRQMVREDSRYMADYVLDSEGKLQQVRFDRVDLP